MSPPAAHGPGAARARLINTDARWQCTLAHCVQCHYPSVLSAVPTAAPLPDLARWWPSSDQSLHTWGVGVIMDMAGHPRTIVNYINWRKQKWWNVILFLLFHGLIIMRILAIQYWYSTTITITIITFQYTYNNIQV